MTKSGISMTTDNLKKILDGLGTLDHARVMVGVPASKAGREETEGSPINNATLMYIHENGAPEKNIPARPVVEPAVKASRGDIVSGLRNAGQLALDGRGDMVDKQLNAIGMKVQNAMRARITEGPFVPLAESTLEQRIRNAKRGTGLGISKGAKKELASRAAGNAPGNDFAKPLIVTGQLRRSLTYVIRRVNLFNRKGL